MAFQFEVVKHVTLPLLKFDGEKPVFVKITDKIVKATDNKAKKTEDGKVAMEAPELVHVTNLENGLPAQLIVAKVLGAELREKYPNDTYVGHSFQLRKFKIEGKRYSGFEITEIRVKADTTAPTTPAPKSAGKR